jgi:hypothetical protein
MNQPPGPALTLYFVADNPGTEHNRDLFTWATSAHEAIDDWQKNYETRERPEGVFAIPTANPQRGVVPWAIISTEALS